MRKFWSLLLAGLCLLLIGCNTTTKEQVPQEKLQVAASFYPMAEFAQAIGGNKLEVWTIVPDGVEPHDWEPSPRVLTRLGHAQLLVYNGMVEPWAEQALMALEERKIQAVKAGADLYSCRGKNDPHVWISPKKAILEVQAITKAICKADPDNSSYYQQNSRRYQEELVKLDLKLRQTVQRAKHKRFITAHAAFGHLAEDYGLEQLALRGLSPEAEPTAESLKTAAELIKTTGIHYIFFETLTSPKMTQILAAETGAGILVLDPIEGLDEEGRRNKMTYLELMQRNIAVLEKALNE